MINKRERIEGVIRHKTMDRIPWTIYKDMIPWGEAELKFRNANLSLCHHHFSVYSMRRPNVEIKEETKFVFDKSQERKIIVRTYITPVGEISSVQEIGSDNVLDPGEPIRRFGCEVDQLELGWIRKYPFKDISDYKILEYIIKDTIYEPNYEEYKKTNRIVGSEGVMMSRMGKTPFQSMLYELLGPEKCLLEFYDHPAKFQSLYELIFEKEKEKYKMFADSPANIAWCPDNITAMITSPNFFKKFCLPFYNQMADILHEKDKIFVVHMDGQLRALVDLIAETKIDVIEAFTPPPTGNLPISEARNIWKDKVIWCNFPEILIATSDAKTIKDYTIELLKSVAPGDNFILGFTENFPLDRWEMPFRVIAKILDKYGKIPIKI